jgi:hypothetical protein
MNTAVCAACTDGLRAKADSYESRHQVIRQWPVSFGGHIGSRHLPSDSNATPKTATAQHQVDRCSATYRIIRPPDGALSHCKTLSEIDDHNDDDRLLQGKRIDRLNCGEWNVDSTQRRQSLCLLAPSTMLLLLVVMVPVPAPMLTVAGVSQGGVRCSTDRPSLPAAAAAVRSCRRRSDVLPNP